MSNTPVKFRYFGADLQKDFGRLFSNYGYDAMGLFDSSHGYSDNVYDVLSKISNIGNNRLQGQALGSLVSDLQSYSVSNPQLKTLAFVKGNDGAYVQTFDNGKTLQHASKYYSPNLDNTFGFLNNNQDKLGLSNDGLKAYDKLEENNRNPAKIYDDRLVYTAMTSAAVSSLAQLGGLWSAYRDYETQKKVYNNQLKLAVANYKNEAKAYNANVLATLSGRVHNGMSQKSLRALQKEYKDQQVSEELDTKELK